RWAKSTARTIGSRSRARGVRSRRAMKGTPRRRERSAIAATASPASASATSGPPAGSAFTAKGANNSQPMAPREARPTRRRRPAGGAACDARAREILRADTEHAPPPAVHREPRPCANDVVRQPQLVLGEADDAVRELGLNEVHRRRADELGDEEV